MLGERRPITAAGKCVVTPDIARATNLSAQGSCHAGLHRIRSHHPGRRAIKEYRTRAAASIAKHGGRYLVPGGAVERLEGDWQPNIVVVEFPDAEAAR